MTAAIYARVSTDDQKCDLQLGELSAYAHRAGWEATEYVDHGISGTKRSRPALDRLMADARLRKFDVVLCWKLDRFGRSVRNLIELIQELDALGIRYLCPSQGIDTDQRSPSSRLLLHIFAAFAEFEREMIRERVKAGMSAAGKRGKHCGRPRKVFDRAKAQKLRKNGQSWRQIAKKMNVSVASIRRACLLAFAAICLSALTRVMAWLR